MWALLMLMLASHHVCFATWHAQRRKLTHANGTLLVAMHVGMIKVQCPGWLATVFTMTRFFRSKRNSNSLDLDVNTQYCPCRTVRLCMYCS